MVPATSIDSALKPPAANSSRPACRIPPAVLRRTRESIRIRRTLAAGLCQHCPRTLCREPRGAEPVLRRAAFDGRGVAGPYRVAGPTGRDRDLLAATSAGAALQGPERRYPGADCANYDVSPALLAKINGIRDPQQLQPGMELKVFHGPFDAVIDLNRYELTLFLKDRYAGRFTIGIGRRSSATGRAIHGPRQAIRPHLLRTRRVMPPATPATRWANAGSIWAARSASTAPTIRGTSATARAVAGSS